MNSTVACLAIASERRPKVEAVRAALQRIAKLDPQHWSTAIVLPCATDSGVRATPLNDEEMRTGARQRAHALREALRAAPAPQAEGATLFLGLEGGLHVDRTPTGEHVWLRGWTYAFDGDVEGWGCGPSIELPERVARAVLAGEDLAAVIDRVAGESDVRSRGGTWGALTRGLLARAETFEAGVLAALSRFYNTKAYTPENEM